MSSKRVGNQENHGNTPTALIILDGFGYRTEREGNAIATATMPTWHAWLQRYPHILLNASGSAVGLPDGFDGNSEVGHRTIGAGRVVPTILQQFHDAIATDSITRHPVMVESFSKLSPTASLHIAGLLSDAGVHSHTDHLYALIESARAHDVARIYVHAFLDGRDTPPQSAGTFLQEFDQRYGSASDVSLASVHGRYFAMDRDNNWDRTEAAYKVLTQPSADGETEWQHVLDSAYAAGDTDEFIKPQRLDSDGFIKPGDGLLFFNFRADRSRQIVSPFLDPAFSNFAATLDPKDLAFVICTRSYAPEFEAWGARALFDHEVIENTLPDVVSRELSDNKHALFTIAETEKYAHVTYFLHGEKEAALPNETRILVPSRKARDYTDHPEMSAAEITRQVLGSLETAPASLYIINYANADMVGHSGNNEATQRACAVIDEQLKLLEEALVNRRSGRLFVTADHGNAEEMRLQDGGPKTSHTANPVPFICVCHELRGDYPESFEAPTHGLAAVAPTIVAALGLESPTEMAEPVRALLGRR